MHACIYIPDLHLEEQRARRQIPHHAAVLVRVERLLGRALEALGWHHDGALLGAQFFLFFIFLGLRECGVYGHIEIGIGRKNG